MCSPQRTNCWFVRPTRRSPAVACSTARPVKNYFKVHFAGAERETFVVVFLDSQMRVIATEELFAGTLQQTSVYPREVVKRALHHNAGGVIRPPAPQRAMRTLARGRVPHADAQVRTESRRRARPRPHGGLGLDLHEFCGKGAAWSTEVVPQPGVGSSVRRNGSTVHDAHRAAPALHVEPDHRRARVYYDVTNDVFLSADEATAALAMH